MESFVPLNSTSALADYEYTDVTIDIVFRLVANVLVCLLGVPGNCLILRVYWTKTRKTSTHVLIMALAWADLAVCLLRIPVIYGIALTLTGDSIPWIGLIVILSALGDAAIVTSFLITAIIAADRYDCVCRPQMRFFTPKRAKIAAWAAVLFAFIVAILGCTVQFISYSEELNKVSIVFYFVSIVAALVTIAVCYGKVYAAIRNHVKVGDVPEPRVREEGGMRLVDTRSTRPMPPNATTTGESDRSVADKITVSAIMNQPSTSSTTHTNSNRRGSSASNHVIPGLNPDAAGQSEPDQLAVRMDRNPRQEQGNGFGRAPQRVGGAVLQRKTTRMLFITSVVFLLTWLPYLIFCVKTFAYSGGATDMFHHIISNLSTVLLINNVVNPLIYGLANRRFRKDCREVVSRIDCCQYS